jgi:hypothetical protein
MSTPKCLLQRRPMSAGSASPADAQRRRRISSRAGSSGLDSIAPNRVGTA